ncbi:U-scoloptoxin(01)-Cw1a [Uranotaenia lowii]|uniref:U-scoloptoxin(01)-Cw1a n=1 Tax=Uranotaenia lowii TaxID=190385 RepID=UPI00247B27AB|nr:U-scoloptoxin(01)-Cw1a [Uranotaenia lowii]XP_055612051.1 U-scoloptoxin(01)-Cw1a [Uranotaenia lowii]
MWKYIIILSVFAVYLLKNHQISGQVFGYTADTDYPAYDRIPSGLKFRCDGKVPGYYADPDTRCQIWHWCLPTGYMFSFLCPNGTVFNQAFRVCDWWTNVDCPASDALYSNNEDLYKDFEGNLIVG